MRRVNTSFFCLISMILFCCFSSVSFANDDILPRPVKQAVGFSAGWLTGNGVTYRRYLNNHFFQGTFAGITSSDQNQDHLYVNAALSAGTYLHKMESRGIIPPLGLKIIAGADIVVERRESNNGTKPDEIADMSYYGGGIGLEIGNPGYGGLSLWLSTNYVVAFKRITSPSFERFNIRPAMGIIYGW